jgi:hypothetical protein
MRGCTLVIASVGVFLLGTSAASAKLPPMDVSAPGAVPFGGSVAVRMWFLDDAGAPLPASDVGRWGMPERVRGWAWAYPEEHGRPDPDHAGLRVPLLWTIDHYEGRFRPDEPGPWLVIRVSGTGGLLAATIVATILLGVLPVVSRRRRTRGAVASAPCGST